MSLNSNEITTKNFKKFFDKILPYLGGGRIIKNNSNTSMTTRGNLKFGGDLSTTDDSTNSQTVVTPHELTSADMAEIMADLPNSSGSSGGGEENVQSDWNETDSTSDAFIKNKPSISFNVIYTYIVGSTPYASDWFSEEENGTPLVPAPNNYYICVGSSSNSNLIDIYKYTTYVYSEVNSKYLPIVKKS